MLELQPFRGGYTSPVTMNNPWLRWIFDRAGEVWLVVRQGWIKQTNLACAGAMGGLTGLALMVLIIMTRMLPGLWGFVSCALFFVLPGGGVLISVYLVAHSYHVRARRVIGQPVIRASADRLNPGDTLELEYIQPANSAFELHRMAVQLVLHERASYTVGTDRYTDTHDNVIQQATIPGRTMLPGTRIEERAMFEIPHDAVNSFKAHNNQLIWLVRVTLDLSVWPDRFEGLYRITVLPEVEV